MEQQLINLFNVKVEKAASTKIPNIRKVSLRSARTIMAAYMAVATSEQVDQWWAGVKNNIDTYDTLMIAMYAEGE